MAAWRELWGAVAIFVVFATTLVCTIPPLEAPDEGSHLDYVNFVATRLALPNQSLDDARVEGQGHQAPLYYVLAGILVRTHARDARIVVVRSQNPEHAWHAGTRLDVPLYRDAAGASAFPSIGDQVGFYALRLGSVALGATAVAGVGLTAGVLGGASAGAVAALLTATLPQFAAVGAAITADDLVACLAALFAWQLALGLLRPGDAAPCTRAGVLLGLALVTKKTALCLVPGAALALGVAALAGTMSWGTAAARGVRVLGIAFVLVLPWLVRNQLLYGDPLGTAMERATLQALVVERTFADPWWWTWFLPWLLASFVGVLGWMNVWLPAPVYAWYATLAVVALAGLALRARRPWRENVGLVVAAGFVLLCLAGVVHLNRTFSQPQGRYLFVVMPFAMTLAAVGLLEIARRVRLDGAWLWGLLLVPSLAVVVLTVRRVLVFFAPA